MTSHKTANEPVRKSWLHAFWSQWRIPMTRTRGEVAITVVGLALVVWLVIGQINTVKDRQVAAVEQTTLQNAYQADLRSYDAAVNAQAQCIESVSRSDSNRLQWTLLADIVEGIGGPDAVAYADQIRTGPVLSTPPRLLEDCPEVPPVPTPPGG